MSYQSMDELEALEVVRDSQAAIGTIVAEVGSHYHVVWRAAAPCRFARIVAALGRVERLVRRSDSSDIGVCVTPEEVDRVDYMLPLELEIDLLDQRGE